MIIPAITPTAEASEKPLGVPAKAILMVTAALVIALFYVFAVVSILILLCCLAAEIIAFVVLLRFGLWRYIAPFVQRHTTLLMAFLRSFWRAKRAEFQVPLEERDAPALFAFLRQLSQRLQVPPPRRVRIEMNASAWVLLKGFLRGADATTLGLGYDLVAGLSERELQAVLAHEMVHAKYVRRGLKRWLNSGLNHAARLTNALSALAGTYRRAYKRFELCEWLLYGADRCTRLVVRLVATYSRQDEFEADRGAAVVCGAAPLRSSLLKLDLMAAKTARIGWNERVARLQRGEGFSSWLVEELTVSDAVPNPQGPASTVDPYSTHPSTGDRLAALPPDPAILSPSPPAIQLFANPDAVAAKLVAEIQRVMRAEETRDEREQNRWLKRMQCGSKIRPLQWLGLIVGTIAVIIGIFTWADGFRPGILIFAMAVMVGAVSIFRAGRYRDRKILPIPEYETLKAAWDQTNDTQKTEAREKELVAEFKAATAGQKKKHKRTHLIVESYAALERCDYLKAHVAARQCVQMDGKCAEALLALAVASAAFRQGSQVQIFLRSAGQITGFRSPSAQWGAGWALLLLGDWSAAETLIRAAGRTTTNQPTFAALIAICQARRNKVHGAIAHARSALAAAPQRQERIKLLAELLLDGGYLQEAGQLLADAGDAARSDPALTFSMIRLQLLQRSFEAADRWIEIMRQHGVTPHLEVQLGGACETARRDDQAAAFYASALQKGFFPEAHLGLARLAAHRRDKDMARWHILEALDTSRPLGENARNPLSLFAQAVRQILQLEEPVINARSWTATFMDNASAGPFANQSFLIFATDISQAEEFLRTITDAVQPGKPSLVPSHVEWTPSPGDLQPVGAVRPGIQQFWK